MTCFYRYTTLLAILITSTLSASAQTVEFVANIKPSGLWIVYNNKLFLAADSGSISRGLWSTDGTSAGTVLVKNINTAGSAGIREFTLLNNKLYFKANDGTHGNEIWVTDGTSAGTQMVKDIHPSVSSDPEKFIIFNNRLYFFANDGTNGKELWVTDGTSAGTQMVKDINPSGSISIQSSSVPQYIIFNNKLYFAVNDGSNGFELWVTDGTNAGTLMVKNIKSFSGSGMSDFSLDIKILNNKMYFSATDDTNGTELWVTDGTNAGTLMVKNIHPTGSSFPSGLTLFNNKLYFGANDGTNGRVLYETDGSSGGTVMVKDINPGSLFLFNNQLFFAANDGINGAELWVTDGTSAGTQMVKDIRPSVSSDPSNFAVLNNKLFFTADDGTNGKELWVTDGISAGTQMAKDIHPSGSSDPGTFTLFNNKLYFDARDGTNGYELWVTDGTETGTKKLQPAISPNSDPLFFGLIEIIYNNALYFSANYNNLGEVLWRVNDGPSATNNIAAESKLLAYPNPAHNQLQLQTEYPASITITDLYGRTVFSQSVEGTTTIDTQGWAAGLYHISSNTNYKPVTVIIAGQ